MTITESIANQIDAEMAAILELENGIRECSRKFYFSNKKREEDVLQLTNLITEHILELGTLERHFGAETLRRMTNN